MSALRLAQADDVKPADSAPAKFYVADDIAAILRVCTKQIHRWGADGTMPKPIRLGRVVRWNAEVIDEWVRGGCARPKKGAS